MSDPRTVSPPAAPLSESAQREVTRLCVQTGLVLMQHGAESALIETLMRRLGLALGVDQVEPGVFANSLVLSTLAGGRSMTTVRRSEDRGIHMHRVIEVQRAVLQVEEGALDLAGYRARLEAIPPLHYPRWLVSVAIGLSCAAFGRLAGADLESCAVVVGASGLAMYLRLSIARLQFSPVVTFFVSAFVATSLAGLAEPFHWGTTHNVARASCVLFLVPGFPLINGVSDMVKGYMSTGIARLANATILSSAAATGILLSMALWNMWGLP
jgi:uncharacterized membrane protein YjjP (DUF1212 family)